MGDEDDGGALLAGGGGHQGHDVLAGERVQRAGRLVSEQHLWLGDQAAGQCDPLGLPTGQLPGPPLLETVQPKPAEPRPGLLQGRSAAGAPEQERQGDVLLGGQFGNELTELEHEPEPVPAQRGAPGLAHRVDPAAVKPDLPGIGGQDSGQAVQQGRLSRAAGTHHREDLPGRHRHAGPPQRGCLPERQEHVPCLDQAAPRTGLRRNTGDAHDRTCSARAPSRAAVTAG